METNQYYQPTNEQLYMQDSVSDIYNNPEKLSPKMFGSSTMLTKPGAGSLENRIWNGASRIELVFNGAGKGSEQQTTPETFGKEARQDMRDLARLHDLDITTHATIQVQGFAGYQQEQFVDEVRYQALEEIKRAIDFAADASTGGAVVMHTGEWKRGHDYFPEFKLNPNEDEKGIVYLANQKTGKIMPFRKDTEIYEPEIDKHIEFNGEQKPVYKMNSDGTVKVKPKNFQEIVDYERQNNPDKWIDKTDGEVFLKYHFQGDLDRVEGEAIQSSRGIKKTLKDLKQFESKLENQLDYESNIKKEVLEASKMKVGGNPELGIEGEEMLKSEILQQYVDSFKTDIVGRQNLASTYSKQAAQIRDEINNLVPIEQVGLEKTADTLSDAAMFAMEKSRKNKKHLKQPLYIAPENMFPDTFGSHPSELRQIIEKSREAMVDKLVKNNYDKLEAEELAKTHIGATLDIGHMNTWKKHFQKNENESMDDCDARFNKWLIDESKGLVKDDIVRHIHLADNYGFNDEHLAIGDGTAPINEFIDEMRKLGVEDFTIEPGSFNFQEQLPQSWAALDVDVYGAQDAGQPDSFGNIYQNSAGRTRSPEFIFGHYAPSEEFKGAPFWSGLPLE
ncbi:TIM barrel protein [Nanoarchaeota archaeon]